MCISPSIQEDCPSPLDILYSLPAISLCLLDLCSENMFGVYFLKVNVCPSTKAPVQKEHHDCLYEKAECIFGPEKEKHAVEWQLTHLARTLKSSHHVLLEGYLNAMGIHLRHVCNMS